MSADVLPSTNDQNGGLTLRPFVGVALIWGAVALILAYRLGLPAPGAAMAWASGLWALCVLDLWSLAKILHLALGFSNVPPERKGPYLFQTLFWGAAKVACLGSFTTALIFADGAPSSGILLGTATLVIVPLGGGFWWSQRELKNGF